MDNEPEAKAPPKGKGGSLLKKKVAGIPLPVLLVVGGLGLFYVYKKYEANKSSTSSTATPTASTGTGDDTGGYQGGGGGGGQYQPNNGLGPDPGGSGTTPTTSNTTPSITPLGSKLLNINGESFQGVSSFLDNANGATYYGIDNPTEAKKLEAMGATLVHNPNDPNGKGLFLMVPAGESPTQVVNAKNVKFTNAQNAADKLPIKSGDSASGQDFSGTGATNATKSARQLQAEKDAAEKAADAKAAKEKAAKQAESKRLATAKVKARG